MTKANQEKSMPRNAMMFIVMFSVCVLGSIGIFLVAVGLETGNRIVSNMMLALIEHAGYVIALFVLFNGAIVALYWKRKGTRQ